MIVKKYLNLGPCAQNTESLRIIFIDKNTLGFYHCCYKHEIVNTLTISDFMNMTSDEFWDFLCKTYKMTHKDHDYTIFPSCKTKNTLCIYNNKTLTQLCLDTINHCNIRCKMCCLPRCSMLPLKDEIVITKQIIEKVRNHKLKCIATTGAGEPFVMKKELFDSLSTFTNNDVDTIVIVSNLVLLNESDILTLKNINNAITLKIIGSCSAITPETYKKVHNNDNFYKVVKNIELLYKYNLLDFISFVAQEDNLHELCMYREFWHDKGILDDKKLVINPVHGSNNKSIINTVEYINAVGI